MSRPSPFARACTPLTHAAAALLMLGLSLATKPVLADAAPSTGTAKPAMPASAWRLLRHQDCKPLDARDQRRLPASWHPYLAATRRCELTPPGGSAQITLISIFAIDYYEGKPDTASWEAFPRPLLVDREFSCVGGLPELFPYDQPSTLQLRHGRWSGGFPQEIRLHVKNPAVSGNYDLPPLRWNQAQRRYQPVGTPAKEDPCQTP